MAVNRKKVFAIGNCLSPADFKKAANFLVKIRPLLKTNDVTIPPNKKNNEFDRKYNLKHAEKIKVLESLTAHDCIKIEPNNNPRYPDADVYCFNKNITIVVYGEDENPCVYIKMYVMEFSNHDDVIVISFHEEGLYE